MTQLVDLATFRAEARAGKKPAAGIFRITSETPQLAQDGSRKVRFCFSDGSVDRAGDSIDPEGWVTDGFLKNPVALWAHNSWDPPIGRASGLAVEGARLMGDIEFAAAEVYAFADTVYRLVAAKYVNAVSVGFLPIKWSFVDDKARRFGIDFEEQELLEISVVPVPCNANALVEARSKGIDTEPLVRWAERLLDTGGSVLIPRKLLENTFKAAKTPRTVRQQYLQPATRAGGVGGAAAGARKTDDPDWKVGASRELPIDDSDGWDGDAAKASIFSHAGGDDFDPAIARKGFLAYDAAKPKEKGSYKLPFAHVVDGELRAVAGGIRAAANRLPNTDIPEATRTAARAVIDHYEERMSEDKISLTAVNKLIAEALKKHGIKAPSGSSEGDGANGGDATDPDGDLDRDDCVRAAHIHAKTAQALYEAADGLHKKAKGMLQKAVDHFDNPEAEKSADGSAEDCVRAAHGHIKAASDLSDLAAEHHDKAVDMIGRAVDYIENPEAEGDGKSAAAARLAALAGKHGDLAAD